MSTTSLGGVPVIHLTYRHTAGLGEQWRIACMPEVTDFATSAHQPNYLRSNDTRAVTCAECAKTDVFARVRSTE